MIVFWKTFPLENKNSIKFVRKVIKLAEKCEIQVSYAIGCSKPLNIYVNTFNNGRIDIKNSDISHFLENTDIFNFTPYGIIDSLKLTTPNGWKYSDICNYGHFYNKDVPWEKLDKVDEIRKYFNVWLYYNESSV